jgi:hypothetical protein
MIPCEWHAAGSIRTLQEDAKPPNTTASGSSLQKVADNHAKEARNTICSEKAASACSAPRACKYQRKYKRNTAAGLPAANLQRREVADLSDVTTARRVGAMQYPGLREQATKQATNKPEQEGAELSLRAL